MGDDCCRKCVNVMYPKTVKRVVLQPSIKWNLQLTTPMDRAYRKSRAKESVHWDQQVVMVECLRLMVLCLDGSTKLGFQRTLESFGPGWVVCLLWLAALQSPLWYAQLRTPLLTLVRICMVLASTHSSNHLKDQIHADTPFLSAKFMLLTRLLLFPHIFSVLLEACSTPSVLLQALAVGLRAVWLLAGGCAQELVHFGSAPAYQAAAAELNRSWSSMLLPALPLHVPVHSGLAGRSPQLFLALTTLHTTTAALVVYATYISSWAQLRAWLRQHLQDASDSGDSYVTVDGVSVSLDDWQAMHSSSAAAAVLDPCSQTAAKAVSMLLHALVVGLVCQLMLFLSKLAVYQVLPRVLSDQMMDVYYPRCTGAAGCAAATEAVVQSAVPGGWGFGHLDSTGSDCDGSWWIFLF